MSPNLPQVTMDYFALQGGLNLTSPPLTMPPGYVTVSQNFEVGVSGGYRRIAGYERYDGHASPSEQYFSTLPATITGTWAVGDTITGATSGAAATIIGSKATGFYVCKVTGTFNGTENLQISAVTVATNTGALITGGAATAAEEATLVAATADVYRAQISAVPGSGAIRGVSVLSSVVYAFRDNAGGTACELYKSTASGWSKVSFGYEISFSSGTGAIVDGDTVTGGTSGASAVVKRVLRRTGTWGSTAAGTLVFASITGTFQNGEALKVGGVSKATSSSLATAITLQPGGRFEIVANNFGGSLGTMRLYGCDGINPAWEFDGTTFVPIHTGMTSDNPLHIAAHKGHLFLSFASSLQHSGVGDPYAWSPVLGAGEIAMGDTITNLKSHVGDPSNAALVATTRNKVNVLYGNSSADWSLVSTESEMGALPYTAQKVGQMFWLDDRGVTSMAAAFQFGNFQQGTISQLIRPWIIDKRSYCSDSAISRQSNQYRLFFTDKSALYITFSQGQVSGLMPMQFVHAVTCSWSGEFSSGSERTFFGTPEGYVMELDAGTSFDGAKIDANFSLAFNHSKSPNINKRYRKVVIELTGQSYTEFKLGYQLGYATTYITQPVDVTLSTNFAPAYWDAFTWDNFFWDGRSLAPNECSITGSSENISLAISSSSAEVAPFTVTAMLLHYNPRRRLR